MNTDLGYPTHHLARTLDIEIDEESIYSGEALTLLSRAPYDGCAFPLVLKIILLIVMDKDSAVVMKPRSNTVAFVRRIKEMAPNSNEVWVRPLYYNAPRSSSSIHYCDLVSLLFQLVGRVQYSEVSEPLAPVSLDLVGICNLVHIKCTTWGKDRVFIRLAQQNSTTLESLIIHTDGDIDIAGIIKGSDSNFAVYPHLHTLKLTGYSDDGDLVHPVFTGAMPFPSLQFLSYDYNYAFSDDVFFRDNAATLASLDLYLNSSTITMLRKFGVFTPTSHPKLRQVRLWGLNDCGPYVFATIAEAMQFALGIGSAAPIRDIDIYFTDAGRIPMIPQLDSLTFIQVLALSAHTLELWDVISLIEALPMLSDLSVSPGRVGTLPDGITLDELPAYVISTYAPMGKRFRSWNIGTFRGGSFAIEIQCVLLLALVCPNFTHIVLQRGNRKSFAEQLEGETASTVFKPYAPRFQCFIV
ncbi:hypothetical protein GGI24_001695 [Coemansia furcata]|nr:hypothetical protein GGI24_001695 [Coemansia furcata]